MELILPHLKNLNDNNKFSEIYHCLVERFNNFDERTDYVCNWFDKEINVVFGIDIFKKQFDKSAGYQIVKSETADILLLKLEKLSDCHKIAFKEFLNFNHFGLVNANLSKQKPYKNLYQDLYEI